MKNLLVKTLGWKGLLIHGDPTMFDRWLWLKRHLKAGNLRTLDAGCGSGAFSFYADALGNQVIGISFGQEEIDSANERASMMGFKSVRFIREDLTQLSRYRDSLGHFDQIVCLEMIEHIDDDQRMIQDLADLLNPGGILLLTTPNKSHKPLFAEHVLFNKDRQLGHQRWGYSHSDLRKLLENAGLRTVAEEFISGFVSQKLASLMFRLLFLGKTLAWTVVLPLRILKLLDKPITKLLKWPYLSVAVVAARVR